MHERKELWKEVEESQDKLHEVVGKKGVNSPEAIRAIHAFRSKMQQYNDSIK